MPVIQFPVILNDDVQIVNRTHDGFYIIRYKNSDGQNAVIWLPEGMTIPCSIDSNGSQAIKMARQFILGKTKTAI
jgi:hypothetical protein